MWRRLHETVVRPVNIRSVANVFTYGAEAGSGSAGTFGKVRFTHELVREFLVPGKKFGMITRCVGETLIPGERLQTGSLALLVYQFE